MCPSEFDRAMSLRARRDFISRKRYRSKSRESVAQKHSFREDNSPFNADIAVSFKLVSRFCEHWLFGQGLFGEAS